MTNAKRTMVIDDAGSFFLYENKVNAQSDCLKFNVTVEDYQAKVEEGLDSTPHARTYIVTVWYGQSTEDYACTFGPHWKTDIL